MIITLSTIYYPQLNIQRILDSIIGLILKCGHFDTVNKLILLGANADIAYKSVEQDLGVQRQICGKKYIFPNVRLLPNFQPLMNKSEKDVISDNE